MKNQYDASSIRVLRDDEIPARMQWASVEALADRYGKPSEWIARGLDACYVAGIGPGYFIRRYLDEDRSIPRHEGGEAAFKKILADARDSASAIATR